MIKKEEKPRDIKERTFAFALKVIKFTQSIDFRKEALRTLGRQLLKSGISIGANAEGAQAGQSRADFTSKYAITLKETHETIY